MLKKLIATNKDDRIALLLRLTLGIVMFPHGAQKMLGWFGGNGFSGTMGFFTLLFFIFIRLMPAISIFEMRTLLPQAKVKE